MRISDWSSDVCSSDLRPAEARQQHMALNHVDLCFPHHLTGQRREDQARRDCVATDIVTADRKSVVEGKSVSVRVVLGGRRIIKKKIYIRHLMFLHDNTSTLLSIHLSYILTQAL